MAAQLPHVQVDNRSDKWWSWLKEWHLYLESVVVKCKYEVQKNIPINVKPSFKKNNQLKIKTCKRKSAEFWHKICSIMQPLICEALWHGHVWLPKDPVALYLLMAWWIQQCLGLYYLLRFTQMLWHTAKATDLRCQDLRQKCKIFCNGQDSDLMWIQFSMNFTCWS